MLLQSAAVTAQLIVETPAQAIDKMAASLAQVRARQAALPPPDSDAETLMRMAGLEQAPGPVMAEPGLRKLSAPDKSAMWSGIRALATPIDRLNQAQPVAMVPPEGWFSSQRIWRRGRDLGISRRAARRSGPVATFSAEDRGQERDRRAPKEMALGTLADNPKRFENAG